MSRPGLHRLVREVEHEADRFLVVLERVRESKVARKHDRLTGALWDTLAAAHGYCTVLRAALGEKVVDDTGAEIVLVSMRLGERNVFVSTRCGHEVELGRPCSSCTKERDA
ncbi:MAG TPA: hypothetical protein VFF73_41035 [Planctomycetota bacterium]|nr:hypothetical protein [Planctomycetota bacterium]